MTAASNVSGFTLNRLYLDNKPVYQTTHPPSAPAVTPSSWSATTNKGQAFTSTSTFTRRNIASSGSITALRFYVDNIAVSTVKNPGNTASFQTSQSVAIDGGTHRLVVVAYESTGAALTSSENFSVTANASVMSHK